MVIKYKFKNPIYNDCNEDEVMPEMILDNVVDFRRFNNNDIMFHQMHECEDKNIRYEDLLYFYVMNDKGETIERIK